MAKKEKQTSEGQTTNEKVAFCTVERDGDNVTFHFGNGEKVGINPNELPAEQQANLTAHGLIQKVRDSFASAKGDFAFGVAAAQKVLDNLRENRWTAARTEGLNVAKTGELAQAIANLKGVDLAVAEGAVERASDAKRKEWRNNPQVAAEIARIRAEKAQERAAKAQEQLDAINLDEVHAE